MASNFKIRLAKIKDTKKCVKILKDASHWMIQNNIALWDPDWFTSDYINNEIVKSQAYVVETKDQKICGFFLTKEKDLNVWRQESKDNTGLYLQKMCVDRQYTKRGIADIIINNFENQALTRNKKVLRLDCANRRPLISLYQRNGFKIIEKFEWPRENMAPYYGVKMEKKLL